MKALLWTGPEEMIFVNSDKPQAKHDEVLLRVNTVGICGSDLEGYLGHNSLRIPPLLMGHELSGVVDQLGSSIKDMQTGQKVVVNPHISCGSCPRCIRGNTNVCDNREIIGIHRPGAYADYVVVPAENVWEIPNQLKFKTAALTEPLACALRATRRAMEEMDFTNVVVIGGGTIGILSAFVSQILGASKVIVLDINEKRLRTLSQLGFDGVINSTNADFKQKIKMIVGTKGIDVVIDAAGFQQTRGLAMELLNAGGMFMNIGLGIDDTTLPINKLIRSEINIQGSFCYNKQDFNDALQLLIEGKITDENWTTVRPLEDGPQAFRELIKGESAYGKVLLQP